jgi:O-antigen biosynthesis protein
MPRRARIAAIRRVAPRWRRSGGDHGSGDPWSTFLSQVEPAIAAVARVHRFAQVPVIGNEASVASPLAAWIEGDGEGAIHTRDALTAGSRPPVAVLEGPWSAALAATRCQHVVLMRAGDIPAPLALERLGQAVRLAPDAAVITCDEDRLDPAGRRVAPRFRPGPSPDHWLACDDSGSMLVVQREAAMALAGDLVAGPAWRHELALALAGPRGERHAHVPLLMCHRDGREPETPPLDPSAVTRLLQRWGQRGSVQPGLADPRRIRRPLAVEPAVEVIVCFRDQAALLARCLDSLLTRTAYERLGVALVDNGSVEPETIELIGKLAGVGRVRVLRDDRPFNFAALNNAAAAGSRADVLVFLNNDTEVVEPGWLETMLEEALRPEVGAVAPLLLYPDGTVQHAGAAIGLHGYAGHPFAGLNPDASTPFGRADGGTRNWLAVSAACLMVERMKFEAIGGFDESFVVAGNDVELCLRLTAAGYRSLCVPNARLVHDESRSRGSHIDPGDFVRSEQTYGEFRTVGDPFYNPNLTLRDTNCGVRVAGEG